MSATDAQSRHARDTSQDSAESTPTYLRRADLTDAEREVYESVVRNGLRPRELAAHVGRSESTIRTQLSRARTKIDEVTG